MDPFPHHIPAIQAINGSRRPGIYPLPTLPATHPPSGLVHARPASTIRRVPHHSVPVAAAGPSNLPRSHGHLTQPPYTHPQLVPYAMAPNGTATDVAGSRFVHRARQVNVKIAMYFLFLLFYAVMN